MPKNPTQVTEKVVLTPTPPSSLLLVAAVFIAVILAIAAFIFGRPTQSTLTDHPGLEVRNPRVVEPNAPELEEPEGVACTMDAKICPDGSAVGRSGPNCEFTPCPGE